MKKLLLNISIAIGIATLYAVLARLLFGLDTWRYRFEIMSVTFLLCLPAVVGWLTVYFSDHKMAGRMLYRIFAPWVSICFFLLVTLAFSIEGWACWLMVLPIFFVAGSVGGLLGGYYKMKENNKRLSVSLWVLSPFLLGPLESMVERVPATCEVYTYIDIQAEPFDIWDEVTRVGAIEEHEDTGWLNQLLGFPRPVKAELDFEGEGAYREATFTGGLVFHETVTEYEDNRLMVFDIKAYPHEIPSTTMDEHIVIGGRYFDVLGGRYELEALGNGTHRLHLSSWFEMKTTFNVYAVWWGKMIMRDIQNNILRVEKSRAEAK